MRKCAFIGGYNKTELILYLAKIATLTGQKVLFVDASVSQRARYIVPVMSPTAKYITTFEEIDIAVGFSDFQDILEYTYEETLNYDQILIDIDSPYAYDAFGIQSIDEHCFVTDFGLYSLRCGIEVLEGLQAPTRVTKIYFTKDMLPEEDEYLMTITQDLKVIWNEEIIFFPMENGDLNALYVNQRFAKIKIRGLSREYMDAVMFIATENLGLPDGEVRKAMKIMEKA